MSRSFEPEEIIDPARAQELAQDLNRGRRPRPAVVISTSTDGPRIDADRVATELGQLADVHLLTNPECSAAFSEAMPNQAQVYGGAARVFPPGLDWLHSPDLARLRFAHSAAQGEAATTQLIEDGLTAAAASLGQRPTPQADGVSGVVRGCPTPSQAMVEIDGSWATIQVGLLLPGVAADRVFAPGMEVRGVLDPQTRGLDVRNSLPDPARRLSEIGDGDVIWVRVESVADHQCALSPYPGVTVTVPWDEVTTRAADSLRDLLSDGEVVAARARHTEDGALALSLADLDENDVPKPALAVLPGGPPWLTPPTVPKQPEPIAVIPAQHRPEEPARETVPARPSPMLLANRAKPVPAPPAPLTPARPEPSTKSSVRSMGLQLDTARAKVTQLEAELKSAERKLRAANAEIQLLERDLDEQARELTSREAEVTRLKARLRKDVQEERRTGQRIGVHGGDLFLDAEEQFRFDVELRWALRIPAGEKAVRPLRSYTLGPDFLNSLTTIQGVDHFKVVDVVVEVLTGLADTSSGRAMHAMRVGLGADDETLRRGEYTCWRIAIQRNTPQARRLHFWRSADDIELSRVVLHDDFTP